MVKKRKFRPRLQEPLKIKDEIYSFLEKIGGSREKSRLADLWLNWPQIMGEDIASQTREIQDREKTLILRVFDSMCMQELAFRKEEILEKANTFLGKCYFEKISLLM